MSKTVTFFLAVGLLITQSAVITSTGWKVFQTCVTVQRATNVPKSDSWPTATSEAFTVIQPISYQPTSPSQSSKQTRDVNDVNPVWNARFCWGVWLQSVKFGMWDHDTFSANDDLGQVTVTLPSDFSKQHALTVKFSRGQTLYFTVQYTATKITQAPTVIPTNQPTKQPTVVPTTLPTSIPTNQPSVVPTTMPTTLPTSMPTSMPTTLPTFMPTNQPTVVLTTQATPMPTPTIGFSTTSKQTTPQQTKSCGVKCPTMAACSLNTECRNLLRNWNLLSDKWGIPDLYCAKNDCPKEFLPTFWCWYNKCQEVATSTAKPMSTAMDSCETQCKNDFDMCRNIASCKPLFEKYKFQVTWELFKQPEEFCKVEGLTACPSQFITAATCGLNKCASCQMRCKAQNAKCASNAMCLQAFNKWGTETAKLQVWGRIASPNQICTSLGMFSCPKDMIDALLCRVTCGKYFTTKIPIPITTIPATTSTNKPPTKLLTTTVIPTKQTTDKNSKCLHVCPQFLTCALTPSCMAQIQDFTRQQKKYYLPDIYCATHTCDPNFVPGFWCWSYCSQGVATSTHQPLSTARTTCENMCSASFDPCRNKPTCKILFEEYKTKVENSIYPTPETFCKSKGLPNCPPEFLTAATCGVSKCDTCTPQCRTQVNACKLDGNCVLTYNRYGKLSAEARLYGRAVSPLSVCTGLGLAKCPMTFINLLKCRLGCGNVVTTLPPKFTTMQTLLPTIPKFTTTPPQFTTIPPTMRPTSTMRPESSTMRPASSTMRPASSTMRPASSTMRPASSTMRPASSTMRPASSTMRPASSTMRPASSTMRPASSTMRPASSTMRPASSTMRPASSTMRPASSTMRPASSTMRPASSTMRPASSTMRPASSTMRPASSTMRPASSTMRPASSTMRPASSTMRPASSTMRPASSTMRPASSTMRPASSTMRPATTIAPKVTTKLPVICTTLSAKMGTKTIKFTMKNNIWASSDGSTLTYTQSANVYVLTTNGAVLLKEHAMKTTPPPSNGWTLVHIQIPNAMNHKVFDLVNIIFSCGTTTKPITTTKPSYVLYQRVEAEWTVGNWYAGRIKKVNNDSTYDILFDDGDQITKVTASRIRILTTEPGKTTYKDGQFVEAKTFLTSVWKKATVRIVQTNNKYTVEFEDGTVEFNVDKANVRPFHFFGVGDFVQGAQIYWYPGKVLTINPDSTYQVKFNTGWISNLKFNDIRLNIKYFSIGTTVQVRITDNTLVKGIIVNRREASKLDYRYRVVFASPVIVNGKSVTVLDNISHKNVYEEGYKP